MLPECHCAGSALESDPASAMRILVIEDDRKIASFVVAGFRQHGFAVDHATDGLDGLALARQGHYAAAVVDIMLPKLDGLALVADHPREKRSCCP